MVTQRKLAVIELQDGFSVRPSDFQETVFLKKSEGWTRDMIDQIARFTNLTWGAR